MPEQTKAPIQKSKQPPKPQVEHPNPELASEPAVELDGLAGDLARQLSGSPPAVPPSRPRPKLTSRQVSQLQRKVGNQATGRMLNAAGRALIQRRDDYNIPPTPTPAPSSEQSPASTPGQSPAPASANPESMYFEGYDLKPDNAVIETAVLGVMAKNGIDGAEKYVQRFSFIVPSSEGQKTLKDKIYPMLNARFEDLKAKAIAYADGAFYSAAVQNLETILGESEKALESEKKHYGLDKKVYSGGGNTYPEKKEQELAEMAGEAKKLAAFQKRIDELVKKKESLEIPVYKTEYPDYEVSKYVKPTRTRVDTQIKDPAAHQAVMNEMSTVQKEYDLARFAAEAKFPILASFKPPDGLGKLEKMAEGDKNDRLNVVTEELYEKTQNIDQLKKVARDGKFVFKQDSIVQTTKKILGVVPGSLEDCGINWRKEKIASSELYGDLALALVSIIGGILLAIPTAGASVVTAVGAGMSAGAGLVTIQKGIHEYNVEKAAAGNNFDKARSISQQDPSLFWLALDVVGAVVDIAAAAKVFTRGAAAIRAAAKLQNEKEAAELALQNGGLSSVYKNSDELGKKMAANGLLDASKSKTGATLLDVLKDAAHPTTKALLAGDPGAIRNLVKSHGKWEGLLAELEAGTPEMKRIATNVHTYRQEKFMKPLEDAGFKTQGSSSTHKTSDIDVYATSDEKMGAGAKLIEQEKKLTAEWGSPSWDVDLRITFYTDLKSRLLVADELIDMQLLSEAEKAAILIEQSKLSTKYNMARRLQTAVGNPELIAQIEKEAVEAGVDNLDEVRKLAAQGEDVALRNQALKEADEWEAKFTKAKETYKADKSEASKQAVKESGLNLQRTQMKANFYSKEAILSPGTAYDVLKLPKQAQGLQVADAILEWTAMLEHKIAEYGSVTKALREYEPWKYMDRIAAQAQKAQIDETLMVRLNFLKDRSSRIVPAEVRSEQWAREAEHLGGYAKMDAGNMRVYQQFKSDMSKIASDIRASEMKKLESAAPKTTP